MRYFILGLGIGLVLYALYSSYWMPVASHVTGSIVEIHQLTGQTRLTGNHD